MALNFFSKAISGDCQPEEFAVLKKQAELEGTDWFLVLSLKLNSTNTSVWNWETDLALCHSIMENICTEAFTEHMSIFFMWITPFPTSILSWG